MDVFGLLVQMLLVLYLGLEPTEKSLMESSFVSVPLIPLFPVHVSPIIIPLGPLPRTYFSDKVQSYFWLELK